VSVAPPATHLTRYRGGDGPPVVLLHGLGVDWRSWRPVLGALERRHDVIALDLPGFGRSSPLPRGVPPQPVTLADAVAAELDALSLSSPFLVGNSLGGSIALELARRGRAQRVVAIAPAGLERAAERGYVAVLDELMRLRARVAAPLARLATAPLPARTALLGGLRTRPWRVAADDAADELRAFARSPAFQSTLASSLGRYAPSALHEIAVPVRVAFGTLDVMLGAFTAPRFAAAIPGAELVALPGLGHVPMADDPALVARAILDW
jgi:pimeloyl-ACP methyl ester carboxylesterase